VLFFYLLVSQAEASTTLGYKTAPMKQMITIVFLHMNTVPTGGDHTWPGPISATLCTQLVTKTDTQVGLCENKQRLTLKHPLLFHFNSSTICTSLSPR
jgi:hypothetical protein